MLKSNLFFFVNRKYQIFSLLFDVFLISLIFSVRLIFNSEYTNLQVFSFIGIFVTIWTTLSYIIGRYHPYSGNFYIHLFKELVKILFIFLVLNNFILLLNFFNRDIFFNEYQFINIQRIFTYVVFINVTRSILKLFEKQITISSKKWIFIGSEKTFELLIKELNNDKHPKIINFYEGDLKNLLIDKSIEGLILENKNEFIPKNINYLNLLERKGLKVLGIIDWLDIFLQRLPSQLFQENINFSNSIDGLRRSSNELRMKRAGDFFLSLFLFFLTLPLMALAIIFIYLEDKGEVFYSQKRCGKRGKIFYITKLRTMYLNSEDHGAQWATRNDPRITKIGSFLRKTRLDELPQLLSIMKGDMSLIGPRPERPEFDEKLIGLIPYYSYRYNLRPGLSGWAQVNFPYGASIEDAKIKLSYDLYYLYNFSFWLDFLIFFKTIRLVFNARGSSPEEKNF